MFYAPLYHGYLAALCNGNRQQALSLARAALSSGLDVRDVYLELLQPAMHEVGRLWERNQFTVAEEHLATAITQHVMAQLYPRSLNCARLGRSLVATCIGGEQHELGMRMVADFFELEGWDVFYLGANAPTEDVLDLVEQHQASVLALSVTLSSHILKARELIRVARTRPGGGTIKILVGGQPFSRLPSLCASIGADLTASDARSAVQLVTEALR